MKTVVIEEKFAGCRDIYEDIKCTHDTVICGSDVTFHGRVECGDGSRFGDRVVFKKSLNAGNNCILGSETKILLNTHRTPGLFPARLGDECIIGKYSAIRGASIGSNCKFDRFLRLRNCVLGDRGFIGDDYTLENCAIGYGCTLGIGKMKDCTLSIRGLRFSCDVSLVKLSNCSIIWKKWERTQASLIKEGQLLQISGIGDGVALYIGTEDGILVSSNRLRGRLPRTTSRIKGAVNEMVKSVFKAKENQEVEMGVGL